MLIRPKETVASLPKKLVNTQYSILKLLLRQFLYRLEAKKRNFHNLEPEAGVASGGS